MKDAKMLESRIIRMMGLRGIKSSSYYELKYKY